LQVTDTCYLDIQEFGVILYPSTFNRVFFDHKKTAMHLILRRRRIATNGDVRLLPKPEPPPQRRGDRRARRACESRAETILTLRAWPQARPRSTRLSRASGP